MAAHGPTLAAHPDHTAALLAVVSRETRLQILAVLGAHARTAAGRTVATPGGGPAQAHTRSRVR